MAAFVSLFGSDAIPFVNGIRSNCNTINVTGSSSNSSGSNRIIDEIKLLSEGCFAKGSDSATTTTITSHTTATNLTTNNNRTTHTPITYVPRTHTSSSNGDSHYEGAVGRAEIDLIAALTTAYAFKDGAGTATVADISNFVKRQLPFFC